MDHHTSLHVRTYMAFTSQFEDIRRSLCPVGVCVPTSNALEQWFDPLECSEACLLFANRGNILYKSSNAYILVLCAGTACMHASSVFHPKLQQQIGSSSETQSPNIDHTHEASLLVQLSVVCTQLTSACTQ